MILFEWGFDGLHPAERRVIGKLWRLRGRWLGTIRYGVMDDRIPRQNGLGQTTAEDRVDLILIIIILVLLLGGGFQYGGEIAMFRSPDLEKDRSRLSLQGLLTPKASVTTRIISPVEDIAPSALQRSALLSERLPCDRCSLAKTG